MTNDELSAIAWWDGLDQYDRQRWMKIAGNTGRLVDAWNEWSRCIPTFLGDIGFVEPPTFVTRKNL